MYKRQSQDTSHAAVQCTSSLLISCALVKLNVKHHRTTPKPEIHITVEKAEAALARESRTRTNTSGTAAAVWVCMYTSEADFHKPGIYGGSARVWATAWDVFRRAPPRVGRGGRAAVDFVMCFGLGGFLMRPFSVYRQKKPLHTGVRTGCHYLISLSVCLPVRLCVCKCVCNIRRFY